MPAPREIPKELRLRPFSRADARAYGLTDSVLRSGRFRRLHTGVYICADVEVDFAMRLDAARLVLPKDAVATHCTGLQHYGVDVGARVPLRFATGDHRPSRRDGIRLIRRMRRPSSDGLVLPPLECWLDACVDLDLVTAVVAADWLVRLELTSPESLQAFVDSVDNWEGVRCAREAAPLVRYGSESPRETPLRLMLVLAGLPEPQCNSDITLDGRFIARGDLVYPAYRVVVEYDGRQHAESPYQWNRDLDRHDDLSGAGWLAIRVTGRRMRDPRDVVRRVHACLERRGYTGSAPCFDEQWCRLFLRSGTR